MISVQLRYPICVDGAFISAVVLRVPTLGDMLWIAAHEGAEADRSLVLSWLSRLSDLSSSMLEDLDVADFAALETAVLAIANSLPKKGSEILESVTAVMEHEGKDFGEMLVTPVSHIVTVGRPLVARDIEQPKSLDRGLH